MQNRIEVENMNYIHNTYGGAHVILDVDYLDGNGMDLVVYDIDSLNVVKTAEDFHRYISEHGMDEESFEVERVTLVAAEEEKEEEIEVGRVSWTYPKKEETIGIFGGEKQTIWELLMDAYENAYQGYSVSMDDYLHECYMNDEGTFKGSYIQWLDEMYHQEWASRLSETVSLYDVAPTKKMYDEICNHFFELEEECTLEGEWAITSDPDDEEAHKFIAMNEEEKEVYAARFARRTVAKLISDVELLLKMYGNEYFLDIFNFDLQKAANAYLPF